ncbi:MAG: zinc-ribbon domain-containing protein, partial [Acidobacteriota bacterium]
MHSDRILNCKECGRDFTFTASEQQFYAEKGLTNDPGRCPECRSARKAQSRGGRGGSGGGMGGNRQMYPAVCASCGK